MMQITTAQQEKLEACAREAFELGLHEKWVSADQETRAKWIAEAKQILQGVPPRAGTFEFHAAMCRAIVRTGLDRDVYGVTP